MKKKILFVIDSLHSGGAEKSLTSLLSMLDYTKYEVELLLFKKEGLYLPLVPKEVKILGTPKYFNTESKKKDINIDIAKLKNSILLRNPFYKKKYHGAQITCRNILNVLAEKTDKYDVAIAYSQGLPTYYVAEKVSANKKLTWINTDYKKAGYNKSFDVKYYEKFDNIIAVSEKNKEVMEEIYPEFRNKISVIYDIISPELVREMAIKGKSYTDGFKGTRILTIGRHVLLKGYDMAIDAAKLLKENDIDFRWYSIGEGVLTNELKKIVKEKNLENNFVFLGTYTNPYAFLRECDIYCQTSRFEGFGMAIAEAKILCKPIVATNFTVVSDQLKNYENGLIINMEAEDIYEGIKELIENEKTKMILLRNLYNENLHVRNNIDIFNKIIK